MKKAFALLGFSFLLIACSHISAKKNLESITEIQLPTGYSVLLDEYQHTGKDFFLQFHIKFDKDSASQMIQQIKSSRYYSGNQTQTLYDSIWYEENDLYKFEARSEDADRKYQIVFNPLTGVLNYLEYSENIKL